MIGPDRCNIKIIVRSIVTVEISRSFTSGLNVHPFDVKGVVKITEQHLSLLHFKYFDAFWPILTVVEVLFITIRIDLGQYPSALPCDLLHEATCCMHVVF